ncbi:DNRLRE domain-containing protein, partial [Kibdelosporangium lantanae]
MAVDASDRHITIRPDQAFLTDPATTYPVFLDPDHWCDSCGKQAHAVVQSGFANERNYNKTAGDLNNLKAGYETYDIAGTSRSYIQLNTAQIAGTVVKSASLNTTLLHSWNCDGATPTGLWLTDAINGDTTWNHQPAWTFGVSTSNVTNCNDARDVRMQFEAKSAAQFVADRHAPNVTFVLASTNENSGTSAWRTFDLNPYLQVDFNSYPNTPQGMAMQGGPVPCVRGDNRP